MPQPVAEIEHAAAVVARERLALLVEVRDVDHPGLEAELMRLGDVAAECAFDLAEVLRERDLLVVGDVLVVEDQHRVAVHAGIDRGRLLAGQRLRQIDTGHLAGEHGMDLADREHGRASELFAPNSMGMRRRGKRRLLRASMQFPKPAARSARHSGMRFHRAGHTASSRAMCRRTAPASRSGIAARCPRR